MIVQAISKGEVEGSVLLTSGLLFKHPPAQSILSFVYSVGNQSPGRRDFSPIQGREVTTRGYRV